MQIRNVHGQTLQIAATGDYVEPGATVEVVDDLGASLCEQAANWAPARATKPRTPKATAPPLDPDPTPAADAGDDTQEDDR